MKSNFLQSGLFWIILIIWQGSVYYDHARFRISIKLDNITYATYFQGTFGALRPGMPRRLLMSMQFRF